MIESFYIKAAKINARVADLVIDGSHINLEGYRYERLSRRPRGRTIERRLVNENTNERIIIYA